MTSEVMEAETLASALATKANVMGQYGQRDNGRALARAIRAQHRTLQAGIIGMLLQTLVTYGEEHVFDARNEAAVRAAEDVIDRLRELDYIREDEEGLVVAPMYRC